MKTQALRIALLAGTSLPAAAHVTLEQPQAVAGSSTRAVLRVGHGCAGSPTTALTVRIPAGFGVAKPMPKPGWELRIEPADPVDRKGGAPVSITWRAASRAAWIADAYYDEFVLRVQTPAAPGPQAFTVLQQCEQGQAEWSAPLEVLRKPDADKPAGHMH